MKFIQITKQTVKVQFLKSAFLIVQLKLKFIVKQYGIIAHVILEQIQVMVITIIG